VAGGDKPAGGDESGLARDRETGGFAEDDGAECGVADL
jgi:hypothetical protein